MEIRNGAGESLSITEFGDNGVGGRQDKPREHVPTGTYEAEYRGLKVRMKKTKPEWGNNGEQKVVNLLFKITTGPHKDKLTSYQGSMMYMKSSGNWIVGTKSKLADQIRKITGGNGTIDDSHKGQRFIIEVTAKQLPPIPPATEGRWWDSVTNIMRIPGAELPKPATKATASPAQQPAIATAAEAAAAAAATTAPTSDDLLGDLTELGDFGA